MLLKSVGKTEFPYFEFPYFRALPAVDLPGRGLSAPTPRPPPPLTPSIGCSFESCCEKGWFGVQIRNTQARIQDFGQGDPVKFWPQGEPWAQNLLKIGVFPLNLPENCMILKKSSRGHGGQGDPQPSDCQVSWQNNTDLPKVVLCYILPPGAQKPFHTEHKTRKHDAFFFKEIPLAAFDLFLIFAKTGAFRVLRVSGVK